MWSWSFTVIGHCLAVECLCLWCQGSGDGGSGCTVYLWPDFVCVNIVRLGYHWAQVASKKEVDCKGAPELEKKTVCQNRHKMRLGNWILKALRSHNENWVRYWPFYLPVGTFFPLIFFWCINPLRIFFKNFLREIWTNYHVILPYIDKFDPYKVIGAWFSKPYILPSFYLTTPKHPKINFPSSSSAYFDIWSFFQFWCPLGGLMTIFHIVLCLESHRSNWFKWANAFSMAGLSSDWEKQLKLSTSWSPSPPIFWGASIANSTL